MYFCNIIKYIILSVDDGSILVTFLTCVVEVSDVCAASAVLFVCECFPCMSIIITMNW
jgi:hypothetical protein